MSFFIARGAAYYIERFSAAAIWFPPADPESDGEAERTRGRRMGALIAETASKDANAYLFTALDEVVEWHPQVPHWYLFAIGVDPRHQSEGLGSILMEHVLRTSDADGALAYLESSNPRHVPFYLRHGFEVMQVVQVRSSPTLTLMAREPR